MQHTTELPDDPREPLFINMDETAVAYAYTGQKGSIVMRKRLPTGRHLAAEAHDPWQVRGHVTLVAFITHIPEVQAHLPQVVLGNPAKFTRAVLASVAGHVHHTVHLWRQQSAWNSHETMRAIITLLMQCLGPWLGCKRPVLVLDVARSHISEALCQLSKRLGLRLLYVPAKMTWLLQPLDTHGFLRLKRTIRRLWHAQQLASEHGEVSTKDWLLILSRSVTQVLGMVPWEKAFREVGLLQGQQGVSLFIMRVLELTEPPRIQAAMLGDHELHGILPRRLFFRAAWFFPELARPSTPTAPLAALRITSAAPSHTSTAEEGPISTRTRSKMKRTMSQASMEEQPQPLPRPAASTSSSSRGPRTATSPLPPSTSPLGGRRTLPWDLRPRDRPMQLSRGPATQTPRRDQGPARAATAR